MAAHQTVPFQPRAELARAGVDARGPGGRVRDLPADSGIRDLPVVSFYASEVWGDPVPFAMEVGFSQGHPTAWWPPVDALSASSERALAWDALALAKDPATAPRPTEVDWVRRQRALPLARWVVRGQESERFLFYEGRTRETPALVVRRGDSWAPDRPHYLLENTSGFPVHDVVIVADGKAWTAPTVPAGRSAGFLLVDPLDREAELARLKGRWSSGEAAPLPMLRAGEDCVMMRDPAVPVERASDHRLYGAEVDVLLSTWADRLLVSRPGAAQILYREDPAAVDAAMPARLYTDQYHWIDWRRLSVVLVDSVVLP